MQTEGQQEAAPGGASTELGPGWTLDRYLLLEELDGDDPLRGQTRRFAALDGKYLAEVQLTLLPRDRHEESRFVSEADLARQQESPYLPQVLRAGASGEVQYLSSAWVPGLSLRNVMAALGGLVRPDLVGRILWTSVDALSRLHGRGLAHGDVRPENLRFTAEGALLLDGYLPARHAGAGRSREDGARQLYLPPEWHHHGVCHMSGDVYSLALLAYELLAGRHLLAKGEEWNPKERQGVLAQQLEKAGYKLPVPSFPRLGPVLGPMLHLDAARRPQTAIALAPQLEEALAGSNVQRPVEELSIPSLLYAMARERTRLLGVAKDAQERGLPLAAACSLRRLSGLRVEAGSWEAREARDQLLGLLWHALPGAANPNDHAASLRATALCLLAYRASRELDEAELGNLARRLAGTWSGADGPLANLVLPVPAGAEAEAEKAQYVARLHYEPHDEGAILGLATLEGDGEAPRPDLSPALRKARICRRAGAQAAALCQLTGDLAANRDPAGTMARMARWIQDAGPPQAPPSSTAPPSPATPELVTTETSPPPAAEVTPAVDVEASLKVIDTHLSSQELGEAARVLRELSGAGVTEQEQHYSAVVGRIWRFLWAALLPAPASQRKDLALLTVHRTAQGIGLDSVLPLCERLIVKSIPEDEREMRIPEILAEAPQSLPVVQAASRLAVKSGDEASFVEQLLAAGEAFLDLGEMRLASQMYMAAKAVQPEALEVRDGMDRVMALGEKMAEAGARFQQVESMISQASMPATALTNVKGFLNLYPFHEQALESAAGLYAEDGNNREAAKIHLELATRALYREEDVLATRHLHRVMQLDLENDQALMMLATIRPPGYDAPKEVWKLRISILEREELWDAAIYHARKQLTGAPDDFQVLAMIVGLCRKADRDPSQHLLAQGYLALEMGDTQLARDCFEEAIERAEDRNGTIDTLLMRPGVEAALTHQELLLKKH